MFLNGLIQQVFSPFQKGLLRGLDVFHPDTMLTKLREENMELRTQLAKEKITDKENEALRDQFQLASPPSKNLLPATVVAMPSFFPGLSLPDSITLNKGKHDNITTGEAVIYKNNLIGKITVVDNYFSKVTLATNIMSSFTARTISTNALGVIRGQGENQLLLDNVVLSDMLTVGDMVITDGSESLNGDGYPPGIIVGKITSVNKNPSSLFQKASVVRLIDITKINTVFIIIRSQ
jgi:rod shape-determining protein MreC